MPRFQPQTILFSKYRIERLVGKGGFAEVYLATHLHLEAPRALKILTKGGPVTTGAVHKVAQRFRLEAQLGARFAREIHIARVYDFEWDREQDLLVLVTEYMPGGSLKERLRAARGQGLPGLAVDFVVRTAYHVALGLAALHRAELVHRDIKPSNILYDAQGQAKIADLGVVQMPHGLTQRTELGDTAPRHPGTPEYMSPEQEATVGYLRPASDIYSLGVTLFEALTLRKYKHLRPGTRVRQLRPDVPPWFDDLIARMLAKDPEARPWNGVELSRSLKPYIRAAMPPRSVAATVDRTWGSMTYDTDATRETRGLRESPHPPRPVPRTTPSTTQPTRRPSPSPPTKPSTPPGRKPLTSRPPASSPSHLFAVLKRWGQTLFEHRPRIHLGRWTWGLLALFLLALIGGFVGLRSKDPSSANRLALPDTPPIAADNAAQIVLMAQADPGDVNQVAFAPDGHLLAVASDAGVYLYDAQTLTEVTFWDTDAPVKSIAFSPDGERLAAGLEDYTIRLWQVADGQLLRTLEGHQGAVRSVVFSPDGTLLASGGQDDTVRLWRMPKGQPLRVLEGHTAWVYSLAFSPDNARLASGSADSTVRLWRVSDGQGLRTLKGHQNSVRSVTFASDGTLLASGSGDGTVRLWRVTEGQLLRALEGHTGAVYSVAFSPDDTLLASGSGDGTVRVWQVTDGQLLHVLEGHTFGVTSIAFSPDGTRLASGAGDGTVRLWGLPAP